MPFINKIQKDINNIVHKIFYKVHWFGYWMNNKLILFFYMFTKLSLVSGLFYILYYNFYKYLGNLLNFNVDIYTITRGRKVMIKKTEVKELYAIKQKLIEQYPLEYKGFLYHTFFSDLGLSLQKIWSIDFYSILFNEFYFNKYFCFLTYFSNEVYTLIFLIVVFTVFTLVDTKKNLQLLYFILFFYFFFLFLNYLTIFYLQGSQSLFLGHFHTSPFRVGIKILITFLFILVLIYSHYYSLNNSIYGFEYPILLSFSYWGLLMMLSSSNFIVLFINIEIVSITVIILLGLKTYSYKGIESVFKYFIISIISSLIYLISIFFIYLGLNTVSFNDISYYILVQSFENSLANINKLLLVGCLGLIIFFFIKLGFFPFYFWLPEVYVSSPLPVLNLLLLPYKVTFFSIFLQLFFSYEYFMFLTAIYFKPLLLMLILSNMIFLPILGIIETKLKKLLFYSSGIQLNYILLAACSSLNNESPDINLNIFSIKMSLIYFFIYFSTNIGFVMVLNLNFIKKNFKGNNIIAHEKSFDYISDLKYLNVSKKSKFIKYSIFLCICSLAGLPPFIGFFIKVSLLSILFNYNLFAFFIFLLSSTVSIYYYMRLIKVIFFEKSKNFKINYILPFSYIYIYCFLIAFIFVCPFIIYKYDLFFDILSLSFFVDLNFNFKELIFNN